MCGGVGHQQRFFLPQGLQVQVEHAGVIGQQGAAALALQHGLGVGRPQAEVVTLALGVVVVVAHAVFDPALETAHAEQAQQLRRALEEQRQAGAGKGLVVAVDGAGGALHEIQREAQVALERFARRQAPGHGRQALQKRRDGLAVGRLVERVDGGRDGGQGVFTERASDATSSPAPTPTTAPPPSMAMAPLRVIILSYPTW